MFLWVPHKVYFSHYAPSPILFVHIVYSRCRCQRQHIHSLISFVVQIPFGIMRNQANRIISQEIFWVQTSEGIYKSVYRDEKTLLYLVQIISITLS